MPDPTDVQPDPSPAPETAPEPTPEPSPVSDAQPPGRTLENVYGELSRKQQALQQTVEQLVAVLQAAQPQAQPQPVRPAGWDQYTDEQLAQLAQSGSADAQISLNERIATRTVQSAQAQQRAQDTTQFTLNALYSRYPMLHDASHPLTRAAMAAKSNLLRSGKPNSQELDIQAITLAIADNPSLAISGQPAPATPRRDVAPQSQVDGATPRRQPAPARGPAVKIDPKARDIARRYGVDPEAAMKRFYERQAKGQSGLSPQVISIVRDQGDA